MSFVKRFQTSLESLYSLHVNAHYVVAYSGGVDSHVLLYCCKQLNLPVRAVHVHHGLQTVADDWVIHCQQTCKNLQIPLEIIYVDAQQKRGQSPEEAARGARYQALQKKLTGNDCLLTAQHLDDQAETLLLQLFRTASTAGLSAMPLSRQLGDYVHLRPLLSFARKEIEEFAENNNLNWVEDPTNSDVSLDRNFIRKNIIPILKDRWPEITGQLSTVASLQSNNLQVLEDMAAIDLANAIKIPPCQSRLYVYDIESVLSTVNLKQLSSARLLNLLRHWLLRHWNVKTTQAHAEKISPTRNLLEEIERSIIYSQQDASPVITFSGYEFRKYQNDLYLLKPKLLKSESGVIDQKTIEWHPSTPLSLSMLNVQLEAIKITGEGLKLNLLNESLKICFRKGGEKFHPAQRKHSQSLKKLLQEACILPWERDTIPLLYFKDELIAVIGLWVSKQYAVDEGEEGWLTEVEKL